MPEAEPLVEVHGVRDGVVALQRDDGQREHGQLRAEHAEEAGSLAAGRELPRQRVLPELAEGGGVHDGEEAEVEPERGEGQFEYEMKPLSSFSNLCLKLGVFCHIFVAFV